MNTGGRTNKDKLALPGSVPLPEAAVSDFISFKECQDVLIPKLSRPLLRSFKKVTGLSLRVLWHDPLEFHRSDQSPVLCPTALHRCKTRGHVPAMCQDCLRRHWNPAMQCAGPGRGFTGQCGATNFWGTLQVGHAWPLTLVLHTRFGGGPARAGSLLARTSPSAMSQVSKPTPAPPVPRAAAASYSADWEADAGAGRETRATPTAAVPFNGAVALLRVILHDLEATVQTSLARRELETTRLLLKNLKAENARLQRDLHQRASGLPEDQARLQAGSHSLQIVRRMLEYLHTHYHRPLQLCDVATALQMNACYLSSLFSHVLGVTFHQYLDELRLAKAKELLRNPACRVCEVAFAVGYASAGQFWRAFKAHTGLSPCLWRDG